MSRQSTGHPYKYIAVVTDRESYIIGDHICLHRNTTIKYEVMTIERELSGTGIVLMARVVNDASDGSNDIQHPTHVKLEILNPTSFIEAN